MAETRKVISLPRLNGLTPTLESTALKLMEEAGELAQAIGKYRGLSGEQDRMDEVRAVGYILDELIDVAQTAVTMMFVLEERYQVDVEQAVDRHIKKMAEKGYMI
ncbi:MAG: MazG-like family protein [Peptococcaceae bacterium]|nr:MazG-like family protein [Peptococcaceae bacterium]